MKDKLCKYSERRDEIFRLEVQRHNSRVAGNVAKYYVHGSL